MLNSNKLSHAHLLREEISIFTAYFFVFYSAMTLLYIQYLKAKKQILEQSHETLIINSNKNIFELGLSPDASPCPTNSMREILLLNGKKVLIQDESSNLTGTHKDRLAWEILKFCKRYKFKYKKEPVCSIITSGSAGVAIQAQLISNNFSPLKVLIDHNLDNFFKEMLKNAGCEIYQIDLKAQVLSPQDIRNLTGNSDGIELTLGTDKDAEFRPYYDELALEILFSGANYIFVPYGSGDLFSNFLSICSEIHSQKIDNPKFQGKEICLSNIRLFAGTTNDPSSRMSKLYSPYNPKTEAIKTALKKAKDAHICHEDSTIENIDENWAIQAMQWAEILGICAEPSGIASLALYLQMINAEIPKIPEDAKICLVNTGKSKAPWFFSNARSIDQSVSPILAYNNGN